MKRIWIGIGLLSLLLALGILASRQMEQTHQQICDQLKQACETSQWEEAAALGESAQRQWSQNRHFTASLADHGDVDQIDGLFAQLEVYRRHEDSLSYAATCAYLSEAITALQEAHRLTWWNLL